MSKKLVALSALCALSAASIQSAKVTGFYVGIGGGFNVSSFKVHNKTSHTPGTGSTFVVTKGMYAEYNKAGYSFEYTGDTAISIDLEAGHPVIGDPSAETVVSVSKKVRPSMKFFLGYNYQLGQNFVIGLELSGGFTFKNKESSDDFRLNQVLQYKRSGGIDLETGEGDRSILTTVTASDDSYYENDRTKSLVTKWKPKFVGDLSVRLGYVIPTADGNAVIALRGGAGLVRQELTVFAKGALQHYGEAVAQAGDAQAKSKYLNYAKEYFGRHEYSGNESVEAAADDEDGKAVAGYIAYKAMRNSWYFCFAIDPQLEETLVNAKNGDQTTIADDNNVDNLLDKAEYLDTLYHALYYLKTKSHGLSEPFSSKLNAEAREASAKKTTWTWHVGVDLEYYWSSGVFVRAQYTFRYYNGFSVSSSSGVKGLNSTEGKQLITSGGYDSVIADVVNTAQFKNTTSHATNLMWSKEAATKILPYVKADLGANTVFPTTAMDGGTFTFNHEVKHFCAHEVSFGIGFKFF